MAGHTAKRTTTQINSRLWTIMEQNHSEKEIKPRTLCQKKHQYEELYAIISITRTKVHEKKIRDTGLRCMYCRFAKHNWNKTDCNFKQWTVNSQEGETVRIGDIKDIIGALRILRSEGTEPIYLYQTRKRNEKTRICAWKRKLRPLRTTCYISTKESKIKGRHIER